MDKNLFYAVLLTTLVILLFSSPFYQKRFGNPVPAKPAVEKTLPDTSRTKTADTPPVEKNTAATAPVQQEPVSTLEKAKQDTTAAVKIGQINLPSAVQEITLENSDVKLVLSSRGGALKSAVMKRYPGPSRGAPTQIITAGETWYAGNVFDGKDQIDFNDINFVPTSATANHIIFSAELNGNRTIQREFSLSPDEYTLKARTILSGSWNDPTVQLTWHGPIANTEPAFRQIRIWPFSMFISDELNMYSKINYMGQGDRFIEDNGKEKQKRIYSKEGIQSIDPKKGAGGKDTFTGELDWYAVKNKYFMTAALPVQRERWNVKSNYAMTSNGKWFDFTLTKKISDGDTDINMYIGPQSYEILKGYERNLAQSIDLSWKYLRPLAILFLWMFKYLHMVISNWGLVLIAFSVIIKFVLYPLTKSSMNSMRKMSALQPQIMALKEKHKNNPQKVQQATMELYKANGVNPFGSCLPLLLQMPVFFALYPVVGRAIELRQAMFIPHWIDDLSMPDPYFILPVAMGVSMFFQSKSTMTDPNQKAMMYMMPVMMIILFANFSAGLTLYWLMFNIFSWMQQEMPAIIKFFNKNVRKA
ncbi:MAG: membrane protein insertase YidC [Candidatus Latescibacterota bacterium]